MGVALSLATHPGHADQSAHARILGRFLTGWKASAVGWYNGCVDLWDVPGRQLIQTLTDRTDLPAAHVAFSPVRNLIAATAEAKTVRLYDLDSSKESILLASFWSLRS
jgi:WD40 repeat protein